MPIYQNKTVKISSIDIQVLSPTFNVFFFFFCSTSASAYFMSDLTGNQFYPSAKRIGLRIGLNNAGKYCDITLKIVLLDFGRREAPSGTYVPYLLKNMKETAILIDKPKREKLKTVCRRKVCAKRHQHQFTDTGLAMTPSNWFRS